MSTIPTFMSEIGFSTGTLDLGGAGSWLKHGPLICPVDFAMYESYSRMGSRGSSTIISIAVVVAIMPVLPSLIELNYCKLSRLLFLSMDISFWSLSANDSPSFARQGGLAPSTLTTKRTNSISVDRKNELKPRGEKLPALLDIESGDATCLLT